MIEPTAGGKKGGAPALIELSSASCTVDGGGMATLSAVVTIKRTSTEEICGGPEVLISGSASAVMPVEQGGSPSTSGSLITHTYDWSESGVACDTTHPLKARAEICVKSTIESAQVSVTCPPCEM